jgi:3-deoxy-7-phosphoheptulonate synthase
MILVMKFGTPAEEIERIRKELGSWNIIPEKSVGHQKVVIGLVGDTATLNPQQIQKISPFVEQVIRVNQPFKRASREFRNGEPSEVAVPTLNGPVAFGQNSSLVLVGGK